MLKPKGYGPGWFPVFWGLRLDLVRIPLPIFDAQAGRGSHTHYLHTTNYKEEKVGSDTNLQLLLTKEVFLILKQCG